MGNQHYVRIKHGYKLLTLHLVQYYENTYLSHFHACGEQKTRLVIGGSPYQVA